MTGRLPLKNDSNKNHIHFALYLVWVSCYVWLVPQRFFIIIKKNHYASVSQASWCNMTFTAGNIFTSHSCICVTRVKPHRDLNPRSAAWEADDLQNELSLPLHRHFLIRFCIINVFFCFVNLVTILISHLDHWINSCISLMP